MSLPCNFKPRSRMHL